MKILILLVSHNVLITGLAWKDKKKEKKEREREREKKPQDILLCGISSFFLAPLILQEMWAGDMP